MATGTTLVFALACALSVAACAFPLNKLSMQGPKSLLNPYHFMTSLPTQDENVYRAAARRLMQQGSCLWSSENGQCSISLPAIAALLAESTSPLAEMMSDIILCDSQTTASTCNLQAFCHWDGQGCLLTDYSIGNTDSPCVRHAPSTIAYFAAILECPTITSTNTCNGFDGCEWSSASGRCIADFSQIYFGLGDFGDRTNDELLALVAADGDKDFVMNIISCSRIENEAACTGTCSWYSGSEICDVNFAALIHAITVNGGGSNDSVCSYFSAIEESGCRTAQNAAECLANDACQYDNGCRVTFFFLLTKVAEEDSGFADRFNDVLGGCRAITSEASCS